MSNNNSFIMTKSLSDAMDSVDRHKQAATQAYEILKRQKLLPLKDIATIVDAYNYGSHLAIDMRIPWDKQTEARHLYGNKCFPENVERTLYVENCHPHPLLIRQYKFSTAHDVTIHIKFQREAIPGEKVNGCEIKWTERLSPAYHAEDRYSRELVIACDRR